MYTQDNKLAEIHTTFSTGLAALNGLTTQVQYLANGASGTSPNWSSTNDTHTLNIPLASATSVTAGLLSKADYDVFNGKQDVLSGTGIVKSASGVISYISGTSVQFVKGDGSLDINTYLTSNQSITFTPAAGGDVTGSEIGRAHV